MNTTNVKSMTIEDKIEYFRSLLTNLDNDNETDIFNVYTLINTYNTFDEAFFDSENMYLNDISEFIDVKLALKDELEEFSKTVIIWYLSSLYSCDIKENFDNAEELPLTIKGILSCTSLVVLSSIMHQFDIETIDLTKLHNVRGAFILVAKLFQNHAFMIDCFEKI